jgi:sulfhydrogenase subunit delta
VTTTRRPTLAVWKFSSCDGCQLTLLNCEQELLAIADVVEIAYFPEATRAERAGPYDVSLVEGSVTTPSDVERLRAIREQSKTLVAIGACATAGGVQALRNTADVDDWVRTVYEHPEHVATLPTSTPLHDHVTVDLQLRGCPVDRHQLLATLTALLRGRRPRFPTTSVCTECKRAGTTCVLVAGGQPCLGPVTQAGCGALCPAFGRGCYGCFGPQDRADVQALRRRLGELGVADDELRRLLSTVNVAAPAFQLPRSADAETDEKAVTS